jgi:NADH pyrophosphatase NudC (nudix superfamily)
MHQFIVIRRPDDPEDEACHAYKRVFPDAEKAKEFAKRVAAREQEDFDGTIISYSREVVLDHTEFGGKPVRWLIDELITNATDRFCPHCGKRVQDSDVGDYRWLCPECDEDFYDFECARSEEE